MYKITATETQDSTLYTDIEYTFDDGTTELIRVSHFMPESMDIVVQNIEQRGLSEQTKRDAIVKNEALELQLAKLIGKTIE